MDPILIAMATMRFISALVEFGAAIIFLKSNSVVTATRINAGLGVFGPMIFLIVSLLGKMCIRDRLITDTMGIRPYFSDRP